MNDGTLMWQEKGILLSLLDNNEEIIKLTVEEAMARGYELPDGSGLPVVAERGAVRYDVAKRTVVKAMVDEIAAKAKASEATKLNAEANKKEIPRHRAKSRPDASALAKAKAAFNTRSGARDGEAEPKKTTGSKTKMEPKPEPKAKSEQKPKVQPKAQSETKPQAKRESKTESVDRPAISVKHKWQPSKMYKTSDWHKLDCENFLDKDGRTQIYRKVMTNFSQTVALRGFYSCMLELTYTLEDYFWATGIKKDVENGVAEAIEILREYDLEGKKLDALIRQTREALGVIIRDYDTWNDLFFFSKLDTETIGTIKLYARRYKERLKWIREQIRESLAELDGAHAPKNLYWFIRARNQFEKDKKTPLKK